VAQRKQLAVQRNGLAAEGWDVVLTPRDVRTVAPTLLPPVARPATGPAPHPPEGRLRFGLHLSSWDAPGGAPELRRHLADVAGRAELAGFDSLWVMDHFRQIPQLGRAWDDMPESVATLGYLAGVTGTPTLGCLVHGVTYRNVGLLAKSLATVDVLSGGRAVCGLGAAWYQEEHEVYGWDFPPARDRLDRLAEAAQALRVLWGPGAGRFEGQHVRIRDGTGYPRPLSGRIPLLIGGQGERRTLRLVAEHADACNLFGDADLVRHKLAVLRRHCADVGRDPAEVEVTHLSTALVAGSPRSLAAEVAARRPAQGRERWVARVNPGTVDDHARRVQSLVGAGVQHVVVALVGVWDGPAVERFGEVIAACRDQSFS
jgi:F420-dependent oxidoreductase-like protein